MQLTNLFAQFWLDLSITRLSKLLSDQSAIVFCSFTGGSLPLQRLAVLNTPPRGIVAVSATLARDAPLDLHRPWERSTSKKVVGHCNDSII